MDKISVKICMGTTCYVMGGSSLQELVDIIPRKYGNKVEIENVSCLSICSSEWKYTKAPYVKINDDIIEEATVEKVLDNIERKLGLK